MNSIRKCSKGEIMKKLIALVLLGILSGSFMFIGSAYATQKSFMAEISPSTAIAGQSQLYLLTITNDDLNPNGNKLGSASIVVPDGFTNVVVTGNSLDGKWISESGSDGSQSVIKLTAAKSAYCISPGQNVIVYFTAVAPKVSERTPYFWSTVAYTSPSWAGDLFTLTSDDILLIVYVEPPPQYEVTFTALTEGGEYLAAEVTYWIDGVQHALQTTNSVLVDSDKVITYAYADTVSDTSGDLFTLVNTVPSAITETEGEITVTGYYDTSFSITGQSGNTIYARTTSYDNLEEFGLPQIPGLIIGSYYLVEVTSGSSGTYLITIHYDEPPIGVQEENLRLYMGDPVDFNRDGKVDGNDINMTQTAIKSKDYSAEFDINHDGKVDKNDLKIVQEYASNGLLVPTSAGEPGQTRLPWIDITLGNVDTLNNLIYGETDHFSGFGVH
jgi:Dockerin type I domain